MVCFAIYSASNAVAQAHRAVLEPWGLSYTQYVALVGVAAAPGGLTVRELGERLHLDSGTLSPLLTRLEERGLVARERTDADKRVVRVRLTDAGRDVRTELDKAIACLTQAYGFTTTEQAHDLIARLRTITDGMHELTASRR